MAWVLVVKKNDTGRLFIYLLSYLKVGDSGRAGCVRIFFSGEGERPRGGGMVVIKSSNE